MRVDGPGAWRSSKFSTNSADTMCMAAEGNDARRVRAVTESWTSTGRIWDERAPAHAASPDYDVDRFADDPAYLSDVVALRPAAARRRSTGCAACTCSATSAPTRCRWPASAPG